MPTYNDATGFYNLGLWTYNGGNANGAMVPASVGSASMSPGTATTAIGTYATGSLLYATYAAWSAARATYTSSGWAPFGSTMSGG